MQKIIPHFHTHIVRTKSNKVIKVKKKHRRKLTELGEF